MKQTFYWLLLCPALLAGCSKDDTTSSPDKTPSSHKEITGYVQKGPFITGTSITVQELTNKLVPNYNLYCIFPSMNMFWIEMVLYPIYGKVDSDEQEICLLNV